MGWRGWVPAGRYNITHSLRRSPARYFIHRQQQVRGLMAYAGYMEIHRGWLGGASRSAGDDDVTSEPPIPNTTIIRAPSPTAFALVGIQVPNSSTPHYREFLGQWACLHRSWRVQWRLAPLRKETSCYASANRTCTGK
jgi:hypothetical protein